MNLLIILPVLIFPARSSIIYRYMEKKNMKTFLKKCTASVLLAVAVIVTAASCGRDAYVPVGFQRISPDNADYRFYVPDSWTNVNDGNICAAYVSDTDRSSVTFTGFEINKAVFFAEIGSPSDTSAGTEAVTGSTSEKKLVTADDYWEYYENELLGTLGSPEYIEKGANILVSGRESKRYDYKATVSGIVYRFTQTVTVVNGTVFIMTFTTTPELFEDHSETVDSIIGYIEIK